MKNGAAVMVTTKHRGVFFGYLREENGADSVELDQARMCVYWSAKVRGVLGLAEAGPTEGCRITHSLSEPVILYGVTGVYGVSPGAVQRWEEGPWS